MNVVKISSSDVPVTPFPNHMQRHCEVPQHVEPLAQGGGGAGGLQDLHSKLCPTRAPGADAHGLEDTQGTGG